MSKYRTSPKISYKKTKVEPTADCKVQVSRDSTIKAQQERDELQAAQAAIFEPFIKVKKSNGQL